MTNVELYEALKGSIPEDAARMIAEVVPPARDLATRSDVVSVQASLQQEIAELRGEIKALPTMRWMFGLFVPVWLGTWGTVIAVLIKG